MFEQVSAPFRFLFPIFSSPLPFFVLVLSSLFRPSRRLGLCLDLFSVPSTQFIVGWDSLPSFPNITPSPPGLKFGQFNDIPFYFFSRPATLGLLLVASFLPLGPPYPPRVFLFFLKRIFTPPPKKPFLLFEWFLLFLPPPVASLLCMFPFFFPFSCPPLFLVVNSEIY